MMRALLCGVLSSALLFAGCGGDPAPREEAASTNAPAVGLGSVEAGKVARAASIAKEVRAQPDSAAVILQRHGMEPGEWSALMVEIAADSTLSAEFQAALGP